MTDTVSRETAHPLSSPLPVEEADDVSRETRSAGEAHAGDGVRRRTAAADAVAGDPAVTPAGAEGSETSAAADVTITAEGADASAPVADQLAGSPVLEQVLGEALPKLTMFHMKLLREGEPRGIIGPRDVGIIWERHILNSAAVVPFIREATQGERFKTVADIGSGGGFPGIVAAACLPDHRFTLIEPMERRVEWLLECVEEMDLTNVTVVRARSEEVIARMRKRQSGLHPFAVVTCRAVAPMGKLAGWTLPLLKSHGRLVALKGRSAQAEIDKAAAEIARRGGIRPRVVEAPVGPDLESTHVVVVDKR